MGRGRAEPPSCGLSHPYVLEYPYRRSLGPVLGRFFAALRDGRIEGIRTVDGRVMVPPAEYDPQTGAALSELVPVGNEGVVLTWAWVAEPRRNHPLDRPFAFALIRLDGADTGMLHAVDAGAESRMATGMRVRAKFRDQRSGTIRDLACFIPITLPPVPSPSPLPSGEESARPPRSPTTIVLPMRLEYEIVAGRATSRFLRGILDGRLVGQRCPECRKVYLPPRGACPTCGVPTAEDVEVRDRGTVTTFCIVNVAFEGQSLPAPYACASILLDGADTSLFHLIREIPVDEIRMGLRVEAVWRRREELAATLESIRYFRPTGEPDAPWESYRGAM